MNSRMADEFIFNNSGINEYIKMDNRGAVIQRLFVYEEGGGGGGGRGGGGGGGSVSSARVPALLYRGLPELVSRVPELLRRPEGRRTRKNKNRK